MNADPTAGRFPPTIVARLATDEATARRLLALLGENDAPAEAAGSAFESPNGWIFEAYFAHAADQDRLRDLIGQAAGPAAAAALTFATVTRADWVKESLDALPPVRAGRFVLHGAHARAGIAPNEHAIEIEAGLAFGTGHHGTTRGCLLALQAWANRQRQLSPIGRGRRVSVRRVRGKARPVPPHPARRFAAHHPLLPEERERKHPSGILDIGTGSGVLAIAAVRALRRPVLASDVDTAALRVARDNARRNRAGGLVEFLHAGHLAVSRYRARAPYSLILANILAAPLRRMAGPLARLLAPDGDLVLSGLLPQQANEIVCACGAHGLRLAHRILLDGWVTLVFRRSRRPTR
jgi:ribosomal protein L11 methyltransferase